MSTVHAHEVTIDIHTTQSPVTVTLSPPLLLEIALSARLLLHPTLFSAIPTYLHTLLLLLNTRHPSKKPIHSSAPLPIRPRRTRTALVRRQIPPGSETASESSVSPRRTLACHPQPPHQATIPPAASPACTQLPLQARSLTRLLFKHDLTLASSPANTRPPSPPYVHACPKSTAWLPRVCPKLIRRA